jgi:hypothetical protein
MFKVRVGPFGLDLTMHVIARRVLQPQRGVCLWRTTTTTRAATCDSSYPDITRARRVRSFSYNARTVTFSLGSLLTMARVPRDGKRARPYDTTMASTTSHSPWAVAL